jgi:uridine kinase
VRALLDRILAQRPGYPLRVAIDGPDAAGKTTLADTLAAQLAGHRPTIRASIDGFHHPRHVRYRRGQLSPEGYYHDAFDFDAVRQLVLRPLGPGGDRWYRRAIFDHRTDTALDLPAERAPEDAVLLFDGVFLQRRELRDHWDLRVFVNVSAEVAVRRALVRDAELLGGAGVVEQRYRHRYLPGQRLYREQCAPAQWADFVIDTTDCG